MVKTILKELGKPESLITFVRDRAGHDMRYAIDPAKMMSELGWEPTTTFDEGIKQTVKWYLDNEDWGRISSAGIISSITRRCTQAGNARGGPPRSQTGCGMMRRGINGNESTYNRRKRTARVRCGAAS